MRIDNSRHPVTWRKRKTAGRAFADGSGLFSYQQFLGLVFIIPPEYDYL